MMAMIDDAVGHVLAALQESGCADNTVVIFTSDHGDYLGDFNLLLKGALPMRSVTRVPFIWADPEAPGPRTSRSLASTIDHPRQRSWSGRACNPIGACRAKACWTA